MIPLDIEQVQNFNENKEWIVWRTATVTEEDLSKEMQMLSLEERRRRIRHRESYKKGEGISGSILLQANDVIWNLWHHTGSNNVLKDPRQSASHRHAYEKEIYPSVLKFDGEIHNFWMFPIFDSGKLIGGVRVVNKLESPGNLQVGGWPYLTRIELSLIVAWFSKFLESYKEKIHKKADLFASNVGESQINELMSKLQTSWIDTQMFSAILKHFQRMIFKREEKRKIGSSVLLIDGTIGDQLLEYPGIDIYDMSYPYNELDSFADVFSPLLGMYVFDENGFNKIALLNFMDENRTAVSEYEAIRAITRMHKRAIFIILPRDKQNILFYKEGEKAAELYLAEKIGEWRFRSVEHMRQESLENAEIENKEFIETVLETSLELSSRRLGGLIVLGDLSRDVFRFSTKLKCFRGDIVLDKNWTPYLFEYAKLDGATVIDKCGRLAYVNTNINPINDTVNLEIFCERGARHEAGEKICRLAPQALVVIISENGGISILKNKKALIEEY